MGAVLSSYHSPSSSDIKHSWILEFSDSSLNYANCTSLETFVKDDIKYLALAYQASDYDYECSPGQCIRFQFSKDGETFTNSRTVLWGLTPLWSPVLHFDETSQRLFLFYSESRKCHSPGGDIKYISTTDLHDWTHPTTIYHHEDQGEVPKLTSNRLDIDVSTGHWYLPFHAEPPESFKIFNTKHWCPLNDVASMIPAPYVPPTANPQGMKTFSGLLVSKNHGTTWEMHSIVEDPKTWLIDPALSISDSGTMIMLCRTSTGRVYRTVWNTASSTWSKPFQTPLQNPNSKLSTVMIDDQLLIVHNAGSSDRYDVTLSLSVDNGKTFETLMVIDKEDPQSENRLCNPCIVHYNDNTVKVAYTVWGKGLKLATIALATVDE